MSITNGYITSDKIIVFPTTRRIGKSQESRFLSEKAITRIINSLIDTDGFVITETCYESLPFEFNIHGYYFKVESLSDITSGFEGKLDIYASIDIDVIDDVNELKGFDDDNNGEINSLYSGVKFESTKSETTSSHFCLHILTRQSITDDWEVTLDGKEKFMERSFRVDGGIIK